MVLILIIPTWIITKYFPMFYILEVLPISYIVFSITSFIQIIEFLIKNKFSKKKQKISKTYKRFDEGGMSVLDHKRKACVITEG